MGVVLALAHFKDTPETALPGALFAVWIEHRPAPARRRPAKGVSLLRGEM